MSRYSSVLKALKSRVSAIRKADGYETDAGYAVFVGETPPLGDSDPEDAIAIVPQDTQPAQNRMEVWPLEVQALTKAGIANPYLRALDIHGDLVKAIELADLTLGGLVKRIDVGPMRLLEREPGSLTVGVTQLYQITFVREWGKP